MRGRSIVGFGVMLGMVAGCGGGETEPSVDRGAPGFLQIHELLLAEHCSQEACHSGVGIARLSFDDPQAAYDHLLGDAPTNGGAAASGMGLVVPGDPEASFLVSKLELPEAALTDAGWGSPMPLGAVEVPGPNTLQAIRDWIEAGAPFDGGMFELDMVEAEGGSYVDCEATDEAGMRACFGPEPDPSKALRLYTPPMVVGPGEEVLMCTNLEFVAPEDILFKAVRGGQMRGGHHAGVFVSIQPSEDYVPTPCGNDMSHLRYTAGAGGGGNGFTELPDGVALRIEAGQQVVIQSHYVNATNETLTVMDMVELDYTTAEESPTVADAFAIINEGFEIPAGAKGFSRVTECRLEEDMDIYMMLGHTHEYGVGFQVERLAAGGGAPELLYTATDGKLLRESPEIKLFQDPLKWRTDDVIRVSCTWDNTSDAALEWPHEMCVALMYYGPGHGWLTCTELDGVPQGGSDGTEGCVAADAPGNEKGVGKACTSGGGECADNGEATVCLGDFDAQANFCSLFGCTVDADCGTAAVCSEQSGIMVCIPNECT